MEFRILGPIEVTEEDRPVALGAAKQRALLALLLLRANEVVSSDRLVDELESLVRAEPLRERPRAQLMLALYRSGRQAEALEAYREARRVLVDDLGLEPSRPLQELERAILTQDDALDAPGRGGVAG